MQGDVSRRDRDIPLGATRAEREDIAIITASGLFDAPWYLAVYTDVAEAGMDPLLHYVRYGAAEGRLPFRSFNPARHLEDLPQGPLAERNILARCIIARSRAREGQNPPDEAGARALFSARARALRPLLARHGLDFRLTRPAEISVIVVLYNQFDLTLAALDSLHAACPGGIDLLLVDSGSTDATRHIERYVKGARLLRLADNGGFIAGCNAAMARVLAPITLFMNNDILLHGGAVAALLRRFAATPEAGAVGAKVLRASGVLQEAGCILWRDGASQGYLRGSDPNRPEANFVREADFCSGVFLGVRTPLLRALRGFDPRFAPAYYEDADLCVRIAAAGYKVLYDPAITVIHREHSSSDTLSATALIANNRSIFAAKHAAFLQEKPPRRAALIHAARSPRPDAGRGYRSRLKPLRLLFVEDRLPLRHLGSGYTRSNDIIAGMAALGHQVTVFPIRLHGEPTPDIYRDFPDTVEIIHDRELADFEKFAAERSGYFDAIWIARTHNAAALAPSLARRDRGLPVDRIVLDTEVVAAKRSAAKAALRRRARMPGKALARSVALELAPAGFCRRVVAVSEADAEAIREAGFADVPVLGHGLAPCPTPRPFHRRRDLLFIGAIHQPDGPNFDGLTWFISRVLPLLDRVLPADIRFTVAGHAEPGVALAALAAHPRVDLIGSVDNLEPLYDSHRLFIAPTRYAGGIAYKLHEAAAHGLPIVTSALLAGQLGWRDGVELLAAPTTRPRAFAARIRRAYCGSRLWARLREMALRRVAAECRPEDFRRALARILDGLDATDAARPEQIPGIAA